MSQSSSPATSVQHETPAQATERYADYWKRGAWNEPDREQALICMEQAVNGWKNFAYTLLREAEKATASPSTAAAASGDTPRVEAETFIVTVDGAKMEVIDAARARQLERELAGLGRDYERLLKESTDELKAARSSIGGTSAGERAVSFFEWWDAAFQDSFISPSQPIRDWAWKAWNAALDSRIVPSARGGNEDEQKRAEQASYRIGYMDGVAGRTPQTPLLVPPTSTKARDA